MKSRTKDFPEVVYICVMLLVPILVYDLYCVHAQTQVPDKIQVQIAVIISGNNSRLFSLDRVKPCMDYVIEKLNNSNLLPPNVELNVHYNDSKCNTKDGPVAAFNLIAKGAVDVFIGPVCDYSLAPVARYAPYWNLPVISPGGFAHDFGFNKNVSDPEFPTLTRIGATFNSLAYSIIFTTQHYNWSKIKFIYDGEGHSEVTPSFCFLAGSSLIYYIKGYIRSDTNQTIDHDFYLYVPRKDNIEKMLRHEIGNTYSSPVCDYAIAPVARFSPHWNIPVISAGAMATDFDNKIEYKLLTRIHGSYSDVTGLILEISRNFNWTRHGLLYHDNKVKGKGKSPCYFTIEALFFELRNKFGIQPWNFGFDENDPKQFNIEDMLQKMSQNARSKYNIYLF